MKKQLILIILVILSVFTNLSYCDTYFDDGGTHTIFHNYDLNVHIYDDFLSNPTTVNLVSGGSVGAYLHVYNNSQLNMYGGNVNQTLETHHNSYANVYGGQITHDLRASHSSQIHMTNGSVIGDLEAWNSSQVTMSGGSVEYTLYAGYWGDCQSILTLLGENFAINGSAIGYGEYFASDFSSGNITGTLANGNLLDNAFEIHGSSSLVLQEIPEPSAILLLALGTTLLRKKYC